MKTFNNYQLVSATREIHGLPGEVFLKFLKFAFFILGSQSNIQYSTQRITRDR